MSAEGSINVDDRAERAAVVALANLAQVGPRRLALLLAEASPTQAVAQILAGRCRIDGVNTDQMAEWRTQLRTTEAGALLDHCRREGVLVSLPADQRWPERLNNDPEPPAVLFTKGTLASLSGPTVGVVGTRRCTRYGRDIAFDLGRELAGAGVAVVSGLALGIDAAAHAGVLRGRGMPVGVVAGGLDLVYPPANRGLWEACVTSGVLLSEMPLGAQTGRWGFPARNRIIAALSDLVIVVESGAKGGSFYTVDEALRRDRPVFAVPGPIRSAASAGTNRLLADGAHPLCTIDDVFEALALDKPGPTPKPVVSVDPESTEVLDLVGWQPTTLDELVVETSRDAAAVALEVERLLAAGLLVRSGPWLERTGRPQ